jgi:hypothetical protein
MVYVLFRNRKNKKKVRELMLRDITFYLKKKKTFTFYHLNEINEIRN